MPQDIAGPKVLASQPDDLAMPPYPFDTEGC